MKKLCLQADASAEGQRIDKYLAVELSDYSRSFLQKQLKEGNVTIGEKAVKSSYQLSEEEEITVLIQITKNQILSRRISRYQSCMRMSSF